VTINYPRDFPTKSFKSCDFKLMRSDAVNRSYGGRVDAMELTDPYWQMTATTSVLLPPQRALWRAWNASLKGSTKTFYAFDPDTRYPQNYGASVLNLMRAGGGSFDGTCTLTATTTSSLSLSTLPANYSVAVGDYVSIQMSIGTRSLHIVTEPIVASAGGVVTVSVEPPVRTGAILSAFVQLVEAKCLMVMAPQSFSSPASEYSSPISFQGVQVLA
jgi:hypothetical protein